MELQIKHETITIITKYLGAVYVEDEEEIWFLQLNYYYY